MKRGFTLIELLIVTGIITILAVIALPNYLNLRNRKRLDLAADRIVREVNLDMSRSRAQENGLQWWIHFEKVGTDSDRYTVCSGAAYSSLSQINCASEGGTEQSRSLLGTGLQFDATMAQYTDAVFAKATGLPVDAAGLPKTTTIIIKSTPGGWSRTITINANGSVSNI